MKRIAIGLVFSGCIFGCLGLESQFYRRGSEGYERALQSLRGSAEGRKYLANNPAPRVVTVANRNTVYVYPEGHWGYRKFDVKGKTALYNDFLETGVPDVVYAGWKENDRMRKCEAAENEQKRKEQVRQAVKHPKSITTAELLGFKPGEDLRPRIEKIPYLVGGGEFYHFNEDIYTMVMTRKVESVPGLKTVHNYKLSKLHLDHKTGEFVSYTMNDHSIAAGSSYQDELNQELLEIKAFLHTDKDPEYRESQTRNSEIIRFWEWDNFKTADHRYFRVTLSAQPQRAQQLNAKSYWGLILNISRLKDPAVEAREKQKRQAELDRRISEWQSEQKSAAQMDRATSKLYNAVKDRLVIVKTAKGVASGFLVKEPTGIYLYTNEHVVRGAVRPEATTLDGTEIELGAFELAKGIDAVRFAVNDKKVGMEIARGTPELGVPVTVFGNSDGAGVVTSLQGKVLGVGPTLLEVSAEFVQGNSGSPVLSLDGRVIGIATFAVNAVEKENWVKQDTRFNGVRRFAVRVDNAEWQLMDWNMYSTVVNRFKRD